MTGAFIFSIPDGRECGEGGEEPPQDGKTAGRDPNKQDGVSNHTTTTTTVLLLVVVVVVTATAPSSSSPVVEVTS